MLLTNGIITLNTKSTSIIGTSKPTVNATGNRNRNLQFGCTPATPATPATPVHSGYSHDLESGGSSASEGINASQSFIFDPFMNPTGDFKMVSGPEAQAATGSNSPSQFLFDPFANPTGDFKMVSGLQAFQPQSAQSSQSPSQFLFDPFLNPTTSFCRVNEIPKTMHSV